MSVEVYTFMKNILVRHKSKIVGYLVRIELTTPEIVYDSSFLSNFIQYVASRYLLILTL